MGIPLYFKKISEKYANVICAHIDQRRRTRLYFDLNGAIHPVCRHYLREIEYDPLHKEQIEQRMLQELVRYMKKLIHFSQATEVFIAIDGVAPLAKMNQQRSRRYKSAMEKKEGPYWDTNMISPGTPFMIKLQNYITNAIDKGEIHPCFEREQLKEIVFENPKVIFSSANIPGEGEHKIMEEIRKLTLTQAESENLVIYGLDADLMMLSMGARKPNIYLLREEIEYLKGGTSMDKAGWGDRHLYLQIDILKHAVIEEIINRVQKVDSLCNVIKRSNLTKEDKQTGNFVDDYIFLCFLFGNDFLPHPLVLSLRYEGLDHILNAYVKSYIQMGTQHLIQNGKIYTPQFRYILELLSREETKYAKKIHRRRKNFKVNTQDCTTEEERLKLLQTHYPIRERLHENEIEIGSPGWRMRYYRRVFPIQSENEMRNIVMRWCKTLKWNLEYYFVGCPQQDWVYGFHELPCLEDIHKVLEKEKHFDFKNFTFKKGTPHSPLVQLLSILPPQSADLLPKNAQQLMKQPQSPLHYYYPSSCKVAQYFKKYDWECPPILPHISQAYLKEIVKTIKLTTKEKEAFKRGKLFTKSYKNIQN